MNINLSTFYAKEICHKLSVLVDSEELQESYGCTEDMAYELFKSVNRGTWEVPEWAVPIVKEEMAEYEQFVDYWFLRNSNKPVKTLKHSNEEVVMPHISFQYDDGGRSDAGYKGDVGDCTVRAIAIATEQDYQVVYDALFELNKKNNKKGKKTSPRDGGTSMKTIHQYMESIGWKWQATMFIGSGAKVHLRKSELPSGRIVARVTKHMTAVIDGTIHDTYDCSRGGTRCVYGYFYSQKGI